jgi:hypothetical protein
MLDNTSRTVLIIGAAIVAGASMEGAAFGQAAAPGTGQAASPGAPASLFPTAEFPTCFVKAATDCRTADGHPDLTGLWSIASGGVGTSYANGSAPSVGGGGGAIGSGIDNFDLASRGGSGFVGESDGALLRMSTVDTGDPNHANLPVYKPEYWATIVDNDYNGNFLDPEQMCLPLGIPRVGPPAGILSIPGTPFVEFFYADMRSPGVRIRMIPTDGRPHNPLNVAAETWNGDPVGHWEGDTLVIETIGFTDSSWLHKNGYIHGFNMKVTERVTRTGNTFTWATTVEDPDYLLQPWNLTPVTMKLVTDPNAQLFDALPCMDLDNQHTTSHTRST